MLRKELDSGATHGSGCVERVLEPLEEPLLLVPVSLQTLQAAAQQRDFALVVRQLLVVAVRPLAGLCSVLQGCLESVCTE